MLKQFWKDEDGVFALVTALTLPVLVAASIFGTELGMWAYRHQQMQGATDAAAIAGVIAGVPGSPRIVQGRAVTAASGFVHGVDGVSVTINSPPASGPYASRSDAVEAIVQRSYAPLIAKFISGNPVVVRARSVPLPNLSGGACVLALNNSESDAMTVWGSATVSLNGCNAVSNSSHASAISAGGSGTLKVASAISAGGISGENRIVAQNGLVRNATPLDDPYESRSYPEFDKNAARSFFRHDRMHADHRGPGDVLGRLEPFALLRGLRRVSDHDAEGPARRIGLADRAWRPILSGEQKSARAASLRPERFDPPAPLMRGFPAAIPCLA